MFVVNKPKQEPIVVIHAASAAELSAYEKQKLASIEENAQENKIESVSLVIDGESKLIEPLNKEVRLDLGSLALKSSITPTDISADELFYIKCTLDAEALKD